MKKLVMFIALVAFATGCASTSDVENLQGQIDTLKPLVSSAVSDAASAKESAVLAASKAASAEASANAAAASAKQVSDKLDRLFKKLQFK